MKKLFAVFTLVMALFLINFITNASAQTNLALNGIASQSSTYAPYHAASMCNDGNNVGSGTISVCHTAAQGQNNWWRVDLQSNSSITQIRIFNRLDNLEALCYRLKDYTVSILDEAGNVVWSQQATDCPRTYTDFFMPAKTGKTIIVRGGPSSDYLNMSEVEVFGTAGIAIKLPSGPCPPNMPPRPDGGPVCGGSYTLADMGYFDANDVWVWDPRFLDTITIAHLENTTLFGADWLNKITPKYMPIPAKVGGRLERRHYSVPDQEQMRLAVQVTSEGETISYPQLILRECWKRVGTIPNQQNVSTPCHIDPEVEWVDIFNTGTPTPLYITEVGTASVLYKMSDIESVKWVERDLMLTPFMMEDGSMKNTPYDLTKNFWSPQGWSNPIDLHFQLKPIPLNLVAGETATFEIKIKGVVTPLITKSTIRTIYDMPAIPATKQVGSEKKSMKTVNNIAVREVPDPDGLGPALFIQWPEPDSSLFGGLDLPANTYQVKVFVGAYTPNDLTSTIAVYLWYNIPAQMGTCVVDGATYVDLLAKMAGKGFSKTDLRVGINYREVYNTEGGIQYYNRGFSPYVQINEF